jgi:uncharacterized protein
LEHAAEKAERGMMNAQQAVPELQIDVSNALPLVGDHKRVQGAADLAMSEGYEMTLEPGDGIGWTFDLRRIAGALEMTGEVSGVAALSCYRCLEDFAYQVSIRLKEHALWPNAREGEEDLEGAADYLVMDGMIDLEPVLRDAVVLALPARRICDESCRGLCARCGANLNSETCSCGELPADSRLSPLADLKKRLEGAGDASP